MRISPRFIVAAAALTLPNAANAADPTAKPSPASPAASPAASAPVASAPERRYCTVDTPTGSRIPRKRCATRGEWLKQGFDPLAQR